MDDKTANKGYLKPQFSQKHFSQKIFSQKLRNQLEESSS